jgi:hypothetical protein
MTPPDRLPAEPQADVTSTSRDRESAPPAPQPELGPAQAAVIAAQQTAGNRAVASVLGGGGRGVQRAPNDEIEMPPMNVGSTTITSAAPRPQSEGPAMQVTSQTLDSAAPRPAMQTGSSTITTAAPGPGSGTGGPTGAPQTGPGATPLPWVNDPKAPPMDSRTERDPRFKVGGEFGPKPVGPGTFGGSSKPVSAKPDPIEVNAQGVQTAFERNPSRVVRSPSDIWHEEAWHKSKGFEKFPGKPVPQAFSDGSVLFVSPTFAGTASKLPHYSGTDAAPAGPAAPAPGGGERPMARMPQSQEDRTEARQRQAVAPDLPVKGAWGSQVAYKVTYQEAADYAAKNPDKVFRNETELRHTQGWRTDGGKGGTPGAYRVGDQIYISRGFPIDNVPFLTMPGSIGPGANAGPKGDPGLAAKTVAPGGTTYAEGSALKSYSAITSEAGGRTETRTRSREQAVVTTAVEVTEGGMTNRQEKQRGAGLGVGGNLLGTTIGSTDTSKIDGDVVAAKKQKALNVGVAPDLKLAAERKATKEIVTGTDPEGNPIKQSTSTKVGGKADLDSWQAGGSADKTNARGNTIGAGGGLKGDWKGNIEVEAFINLQTKGGLSFKPTASHGIKVEASEPIEAAGGGFEIVYRIIESSGVGVGGGKQTGGGASVGVNVGATKGEFQGGRRSFKTKDEANAFRDNAAARVATEQLLTKDTPVTTVAGALQIPVGETRTSGDISGKSIGAQAGYSGVAINVGKSTSKTHELAVKRTGEATFEVTGSVSGSKTGSVGISAPVLSHGYSSTNTTSFAVTFEFDVSKEQGRAAFELYCKTGIPPMQPPKVIEKAASDSDHETVTIPGLGSAVWTGSTWQVTRDTADGHTTQVYGGSQSHQQTPGRVGKLIGEDTLKSNASITRVVVDGEEVASKAQFNVGGTSGDYNRKELGKIFMGAKTEGDVKPSGEWTISADVPKESIDALAKNSRKIRNAMDERQAYSELVKEGGAQMLGGQVGITSKSWDVELKGDPNFPGEKERTRLKQLRKDLMARVRSNPELANDIVRESGAELAKLATRREAVGDLKRYTDLPDGLRQEQLAVIDMHVDDMKVVRRTAQSIAMKRNAGERQADVATRVEQAEKAGPGAKAGSRAKATKAPVEDETQKLDREYAKVQDQVSAKESQIAVKRNEIRENSKALGDAIGAGGTTAVKFGADSAIVQVAIASGKGYIGAATDADKKQAALEPQIEAARNAWSATNDKKDQLPALKALERLLDERLKLMHSTLYMIREAGKAVFHITTRSAKSGNPAFWGSLGETEGEE